MATENAILTASLFEVKHEYFFLSSLFPLGRGDSFFRMWEINKQGNKTACYHVIKVYLIIMLSKMHSFCSSISCMSIIFRHYYLNCLFIEHLNLTKQFRWCLNIIFTTVAPETYTSSSTKWFPFMATENAILTASLFEVKHEYSFFLSSFVSFRSWRFSFSDVGD